MKKQKSNIDIRKETKEAILETIRNSGDCNVRKLAAQATNFNGWKIDTNEGLIQELEETGFVEIAGGIVRLKTKNGNV